MSFNVDSAHKHSQKKNPLLLEYAGYIALVTALLEGRVPEIPITKSAIIN